MFFPKLSGPLPTPSTKHPSRIPPPAIRISPPVPLIHKPCIHTCSTGQSPNPLTRPQGPLPAPSPDPGTTCLGALDSLGAGSPVCCLGRRDRCCTASSAGNPRPAPFLDAPRSSCLHTPGRCAPANTGACVQCRCRYLWVFFVQLKFSETDVVPTLFTIFNIWHSTGLNKSFSWGKQDKSVSETDTEGGLCQ